MWPFSQKTRPVLKSRRTRRDIWPATQPLIRWSHREAFTCQDSYAGTLITGATGSGKTTGSGAWIAEKFMLAGYGGIVLLVKDDWKFWKSLAAQTGRSRDLVRFCPSEPWKFNFLNHEMTRPGKGAGLTENIVRLFMAAMEISERSSGKGGGRENGEYWERACRQLCRNLVDLLAFSLGRVSIPELYQLVITAPKSREQLKSKEWQKNSFCYQCLMEAERKRKTPRHQRDFGIVADYFIGEFVDLSPKTRGIIISTFSTLADSLQRGILRDLLCEETNVTPEAAEDGHIIVVDMPIKEYGEVGLLAQSIWKYAFERSIERRNIQSSPRPVFLWIDEAQFLVNAADMEFLSTCRSSRVATVFLTQNISNFYSALGEGTQGKAQADSIFGNLTTKIFHANGDPITNEWGSSLIGRTRQFFINANTQPISRDWIGSLLGAPESQTSSGISENIDFEVQPSAFTMLRTGGAAHGGNIDGIVFQSGKVFRDTGRTWRYATFKQKR
ncbi:TraM recognition domain-containing protein [bacterium]|nr:TraM recognition domain-containing protein [bacterium]